MKFTVKTLDGKTQEFDLPGQLTIGELKVKVQDALGLPADTQRMLLSGKAMSNELTIESCGVEGKVIHLVKTSPSVQKSAVPPQVPVSMRPEKRSNEYMYIGVTPEPIPPPSDVLYLQDVAKDSADNILGNVTSGGHPNALVTVTVHTLTPDGHVAQSSTHTSTSYKPGSACLIEEPDPAVAEEELRKRKEREEQRQARRARLARYREKVKEQQRTGREQTNILEIYQHMTSVRRAIQGAENILEDYLNSSDFKEAKEVLEHHMKLKAEAEKEAAASKPKEGDEVEGATSLEEPKSKEDGPKYAMGEDGRPRQHILTDTGMLLPAGAHLYAALLDDIMVLQRRGLELHEFYAKKIYAEEHYEYEDYRCNSKLVTAIQRYHNAMGQAYNSIKRVQVTLEGEPPRIVNLIPSSRPSNPLLSLLSQPLGGDSDNEEPSSSQQGEEEGGQSIAGLLGSLMATRAAMRMMEDDEQQQRTPAAVTAGPSTDPDTTSDNTTTNNDDTSGGATGTTSEGNEEQSKDDKKEEEDEDEINPFLPGPVHLLQQMMRQKQERERQQQQERTVVIQPDQPFYETIARIRQAVGGPEEEIMPPTLIGNLVERCMRKMSISEVVTVFGGTTGPLVTIHPTLRDFIRERLLDGEEPTNDNIPQAIDKFVEGLPAVLNGLDPPIPLREDVDFGASAKKCCAFKLKEVMELIVNKPDDDPEFPQRLYDWAMNIGTFFTVLLRECLLSSNDLTPSLKRISKMMFPDNDTPGVLSMLNSQSLVDKFVDESEKNTIPIEEINCHIVTIGSCQEEGAQPMEVEPSSNEEKDQAQMSGQQPPPLSDAYLSSLPAKKRKQLEGGEVQDTTSSTDEQ